MVSLILLGRIFFTLDKAKTDLVRKLPANSYQALRRHLIQIYTLSDFQRYQALQSLPLLFDQHPSKKRTKNVNPAPGG